MANVDSAAHTFTSGDPDVGADGIFDTSLLMAGSYFEWEAENEGEYSYFCMVHPWMVGTIIVGESSPVEFQPVEETPSQSLTVDELEREIQELKSENSRLKA